MFPVGVALFSLGYAIAYYGMAVLRWVHDPNHPHHGPPSLGFILGVSSNPGIFHAPINVEGAADAWSPFGGPTVDNTARDRALDPGGPVLPGQQILTNAQQTTIRNNDTGNILNQGPVG